MPCYTIFEAQLTFTGTDLFKCRVPNSLAAKMAWGKGSNWSTSMTVVVHVFPFPFPIFHFRKLSCRLETAVLVTAKVNFNKFNSCLGTEAGMTDYVWSTRKYSKLSVCLCHNPLCEVVGTKATAAFQERERFEQWTKLRLNMTGRFGRVGLRQVSIARNVPM